MIEKAESGPVVLDPSSGCEVTKKNDAKGSMGSIRKILLENDGDIFDDILELLDIEALNIRHIETIEKIINFLSLSALLEPKLS